MIGNLSILDYGLGNIFSIKNAAEQQGFSVNVVNSAEEILASDRLILPGVGAFQDAMLRLKNDGLDEAIREFVSVGKPLLGICLGMQLLFDESEEHGNFQGLGLIKGKVKKFPKLNGYKIPQIQWNKSKLNPESRLFIDFDTEQFFYFLHSYYVASEEENAIESKSHYCDLNYCSAIEFGNVLGVQFHPEKSGINGLKVLNNFARYGGK
ncbi:MAG: imidazole glycerol phosphate synthase subunit HisH [Colwellia sp.]